MRLFLVRAEGSQGLLDKVAGGMHDSVDDEADSFSWCLAGALSYDP